MNITELLETIDKMEAVIEGHNKKLGAVKVVRNHRGLEIVEFNILRSDGRATPYKVQIEDNPPIKKDVDKPLPPEEPPGFQVNFGL